MSRIHFIGGEKGGVGKSVVARLLAQYFIDNNTPFVGFDTDASHGTFTRFYEEFADAVQPGEFESLDRIAEQALEDPQKFIIVDLAAQTDRPLTDWIESSGVIELMQENQVELNYWHVMDDGKDSFDLLGKLLARFGNQLRYTIVLNHGRGERFQTYLGSETQALAQRLQARTIEIPKLHASAMQKIDHGNSSFWAAVNNAKAQNLGMMDRQRVKLWLRKVYAAFEDAGI
jgi:hypothetical protein